MADARTVATVALVGGLLLTACGGDGDPAGGGGTTPPATAAGDPASPGPPPLRVEDRQVTAGGIQRSYRVLDPDDGPEPVVVAIHDAGNTVDGMVQVTQLDRAAAQHGFAVVFPAAAEQAQRTWNAGFCCGVGPSVGIDDMAFLDAVLDEIAADPRLDGDRVHLTGVSNGAVMAYRYACERAGRVAGVGSVAGTMDLDTCQPAEPVPVLEIHGTADDVVPFHGGEMPDFVQARKPAVAAEALVGRWAELNGCAGEPATTTEAPVTTTTWKACEGGSSVELIAIEGAGHTWYAPGFGPADGAVDATAEIAAFFGLAG